MPSYARCRVALMVLVLVGSLAPAATAEDGTRGAFDPYDRLQPDWYGSCTVGTVCASYGRNVATDGRYVVISARDESWTNGSTYLGAGAVYIYEENPDGSWTGWRITASDKASYDRFGADVAIDDGRVVVGAPENGDGKLYVYERSGSTWVETIIDTPEWSYDFGYDVDIDGSTIVATVKEIPTGSSTLVFGELSPGDWWKFDTLPWGNSLDLEGDRLLIGAQHITGGYSYSGVARVYTRSGSYFFDDPVELTVPADNEDRRLGSAVALDGDVAFVGASGLDQPGFDGAGGVFAFEWNGSSWDRTEIVPPGGHVAGERFGSSLSAADGAVVAGSAAYGEDFPRASLFRRSESGWVGEQVPHPGELDADKDQFGGEVAVGGGTLVIGAPGEYQNEDDHGEVYVFRQCSGRVATLAGTPGADVITGTSGDDVIEAGAGDDSVEAGAGDDVVCGWSGRDTLSGQDGADDLYGQGHVDFLFGGAGPDLLDGGASLNDWVNYLDAPGGVAVTLPVGASDGSATGEGTDTLADVENVRGSQFDDVITGNPRDNKLFGYQGDDTIDGKAGDDTVDGGPGNDTVQGHKGDDTIAGGSGRDYADFSEADGPVTVDLSAGTASYSGWSDTISGVEHVRGSKWGDLLTGDGFGNILRGMPGDDTLFGMGSYDYLFGADGTDTAYPGAGGAKCFLVEAPNGCD